MPAAAEQVGSASSQEATTPPAPPLLAANQLKSTYSKHEAIDTVQCTTGHNSVRILRNCLPSMLDLILNECRLCHQIVVHSGLGVPAHHPIMRALRQLDASTSRCVSCLRTVPAFQADIAQSQRPSSCSPQLPMPSSAGVAASTTSLQTTHQAHWTLVIS